ncbi:MAG: hypothetical protein NTW32_15165, partial [Chloroflexi bacterium]|nr:hypothetical protein [Chloroflexota bacterium]
CCSTAVVATSEVRRRVASWTSRIVGVALGYKPGQVSRFSSYTYQTIFKYVWGARLAKAPERFVRIKHDLDFFDDQLG